MGTRQLRLNTTAVIRKRLPDFTGKKINIVFNDRTVILVTLDAFSGDTLTVTNMRNRQFHVDLPSISEIYFDTKE